MLQQREAIIRLLRDEDTETVELVKNQLAQNGREAVADLLGLLSADDGRVAHHIRVVLGQIDAQEAKEALTVLCKNFPDDGEHAVLEDAVFLLARALCPGIDVETARRRLDGWGGALMARLPDARTPEQRVKVLGDFFGRELGFHGNAADYYNASNSMLPAVIESRLGIPISLATLYVLAGARAGIEIEGVSFPGHFIVRYEGMLLDPFEGGQVLTFHDCEAILARQNLEVDPAHFATAPVRSMLRRMLANLLYIYQSEDKALANTLAGWIRDLEG